MVAALNETLLDESRVPAVIADVQALIDAEVSDKSGASGLALKGGYGAVKKVGPSIVPDAIEGLLPAFVTKLEPYWQAFTASGEAGFSEYLVARGDEVADSLLGVTDERIAGSDRGAVKKVYSSLRPSAKKNVIEALPRLGALVQKHAN
ncbi:MULTISPECIES: hypothetical protein [Rhodococcus]|uniref:Uncharacterized protein n=1 Tax=Rhodococcus jostii (strain RHA1) TaxID=101510 RepID=Q0SF79_RHOJR|nr:MULTISPECIES: hypothetical protein [Rhodococcus]ABG93807.1 conserved hypothetical protein [Rhodococcus jostii RHA1]EJI99825.1 hypothetical protein JVH1_2559 [Rhodococcus sp. JVH1]